MLKLYFLALLLVLASATDVKFKDCAKHEASLVNVIGCAGSDRNVCAMVKGKEFKLNIDFIANANSAKVAFKFIAHLGGGIAIPVPGIDGDACKHLQCPLVKGNKYTFTYSMMVPKVLPNLKAIVEASLVGDQGPLTCVQINGGVQD